MNPDYAALSASDGAGEPVRATVQSPGRSIGSTTIPVQATTNWPSGTFIATTGTLLSSGKLDPTTVQVFYGTASGTDITITAFAAGYSDVGNEAGDVVVIKPSTEWANVVAEGILGTTQFPANFANFVETAGGVWSAGSGLVGSGTAGFVWYNGARSAMAAVTNHTFTASKDTYIDYKPSTGTWTYVPETNGAAEPAVTASSLRVAKVVTGASAISSVTQIPYQTPTSPQALGTLGVWQHLGDASLTSDDTVAASGAFTVSTLTVTVIVPNWATKLKIDAPLVLDSAGATYQSAAIYQDGSLISQQSSGASGRWSTTLGIVMPAPAAGSHTYTIYVANNSSNTILRGTGSLGYGADGGPSNISVDCR